MLALGDNGGSNVLGGFSYPAVGRDRYPDSNVAKPTRKPAAPTKAAPKRTAKPVARKPAPSRQPQRSAKPPAGRSSYRPASTPNVSAPRPAVGNTRTGSVAPSVPAPPPMSIDEWLAKGNDTTYSGQRSAYEKALADYAAQYKSEQDKYSNEYNASLAKMQQDNTLGAKDLENDYASRGLLTSGVYANALNEYQNSYQTKLSDLSRARDAYLSDLNNDKTNFESEQALALARAKQDAANRRTAGLGL